MKNSSATICKRREILRGVVVPAQWDEQFRVTGVLVACHDEREVRVENLDRFPMLKELSQREALFTGLVNRCGVMETIQVESFAPLDKDED